MRVSQRLFELQQNTKSQISLQQVQDPLQAYSDFRGLLLPDFNEALAATYSQKTINKLKKATVSKVDFAAALAVKSSIKTPYVTC
jgi:hypothetical protein